MNRDKNLKCYSSAHYEMYRTVAWKITSIIFIYKFYNAHVRRDVIVSSSLYFSLLVAM